MKIFTITFMLLLTHGFLYAQDPVDNTGCVIDGHIEICQIDHGDLFSCATVTHNAINKHCAYCSEVERVTYSKNQVYVMSDGCGQFVEKWSKESSGGRYQITTMCDRTSIIEGLDQYGHTSTQIHDLGVLRSGNDCSAFPKGFLRYSASRQKSLGWGIEKTINSLVNVNCYPIYSIEYVTCLEPLEGTTVENCKDGIDNNNDNKIDCDDPMCGYISECNDEVNDSETCDDYRDNDKDFLTDCQDPDCMSNDNCMINEPSPEICSNGIDDDQNTFIDCDDPMCTNSAECEVETNQCNEYAPDCESEACSYLEFCKPKELDEPPPPPPDDDELKPEGGGCEEYKSDPATGVYGTCENTNASSFSEAEPVNVFSGNLYFHRYDIRMPGAGSFGISNYYNSAWRHSSQFGYNWQSNINIQLYKTSDGSLVVRNQVGVKEIFSSNGDNTTFRITKSNLEFVQNGYSINLYNDEKWLFDNYGRIIQMRVNNEIYNLTYESSTEGEPILNYQIGIESLKNNLTQPSFVSATYQLARIQNNSNLENFLAFEYHPNGRVSRITNSQGDYVEYLYDISGNLVSAKRKLDALPEEFTHYKYEDPTKHELTGFTSLWEQCQECHDSLFVNNEYDSRGRVASQVMNNLSFEFLYEQDMSTVKTYVTTPERILVRSSDYIKHYVSSDDGKMMLKVTKNTTSYKENGEYGLTQKETIIYDNFDRIVSMKDNKDIETRVVRNDKGLITDKYYVKGSDTLRFVHIEYQGIDEKLRIEGGYKITGDSLTTTTSYYPNINNSPSYVQSIHRKWSDNSVSTESWDYNSEGQVTTHKQSNGNTVSYEYFSDGKTRSAKSINGELIETYSNYDQFGNAEVTTNSEGISKTSKYDTKGRLIRKCDYDNNCVDYDYSVKGVILEKYIESNGIVLHKKKNVYDADGKLIAQYVVSEDGNDLLIHAYQYNHFGNQIAVRDSLHSFDENPNFRYHYISDGLLYQEIDANGNSSSYEYGIGGVVSSKINALGQTSYYIYDDFNNIIRETNFDGSIVEYLYDSRDNIVREVHNTIDTTYYAYNVFNEPTMIAHSKQKDTTSIVYDSKGKKVKQIDPNKRITYWFYLDNEHITFEVSKVDDDLEIIDDNDYVIKQIFDREGRLKKKWMGIGENLKLVESIDYDYNGRVLQQGSLPQNTSINTYNALGKIKEVNRNGLIYRYNYDVYGNLSNIVKFNEDGTSELEKDYTYYPNKKLKSEKSISGHTRTYEYNNTLALARVIDSKSGVTEYTYDPIGRKSSVTDALGNVQEYLYQDRIEIVADPSGNTQIVNRDSFGRIISIEDQSKLITEYQYAVDADFSEKKTVFYPDGRMITTIFDKSGRLIKEERNDGVSIVYEYSNAWRLSSKKYLKNGILLLEKKYLTEGVNKEIMQRYENGILVSSIMVEKDDFGRTLKTIVNVGESAYTTTYEFDDLLNETKAAFHNGDTRKISYRQDGKLEFVSLNNVELARFNYLGNEELQTTFGNELVSTRALRSDGVYYEDKTVSKLGDVFLWTSYEWENNGVLKSINDKRNVQNSSLYKYDVLNQLKDFYKGVISSNGIIESPIDTKEWNYDPIGKVTSILDRGVEEIREYQVNGQLESIQGVGVTYDSQGNLLQMDGQSFTWSIDGLLTQMTTASGRVDYIYDSMNRLVKRIQKDNNDAIVEEIDYLWNGWQLEQEIRNGNVRTYAYGNYIDNAIAVKVSDEIYYLHRDHNQNSALVTDESGDVVERYLQCSPFGDFKIEDAAGVEQTTSLIGNRSLFQGLPISEPLTGLVYARNRWYNPSLMQWMSPDPIGYDGGDVNLYRFVGNDPVNRVDPWGLWDLKFQTDLTQKIGDRGFWSLHAKANLHNGSGNVGLSTKIGLKFYFTEVMGELPGVLMGLALEKVNIEQQFQVFGEGGGELSCSCENGSSSVNCELRQLYVGLGMSGTLGYKSDYARIGGSITGSGRYDFLSSSTTLYGEVSANVQTKSTANSWSGFRYYEKGGIDLGLSLGGIDASGIVIPLPKKCECMDEDVDASSYLIKVIR